MEPWQAAPTDLTMRTEKSLAVILFSLALTLAGCGGGGSSGGSAFSSSGASSTSSSSGSSSGSSSSSSSGSSSSSSSSSSGGASGNVVAMVVGPGPLAAGGTLNGSFVSVTVCLPGTATCGTVANVLVDTGSVGLRLFASALSTAGMNLPPTTDPNNSSNTIAECLAFADGYVWGPVSSVDLKIGGETASNLSVHVINDNSSYAPTVPQACTAVTSNTSLNTIAAFGANGVLGVGFVADDCGSSCAQCANASGGCSINNDMYYSCGNSNTCASVPVPVAAQVDNPVTFFAVDNNGVILQLPAIPDNGAASPAGSLTFGIGTQSNNALGGQAVLTLDDSGFFTSVYNGTALNSSFIDSGSNGYFFADSTLAMSLCGNSAPQNEFYCPSTTQTLMATNQGHTNVGTPIGATSVVTFKVANLNTIPAMDSQGNTITALDDDGGTAVTSAGTATLNNDFDFGLPFFFGRSVYTKIAGAPASSTSGPVGPYVAY
jgi:hypothetical protein